ncbi:MAG: carboxypeptidase regulatory-like domain-containing protein [Xanthomonadales bacterium]|nr:carboxypeptidase regulatory-like domain-containing protein [Xanthomonadales bacterium]
MNKTTLNVIRILACLMLAAPVASMAQTTSSAIKGNIFDASGNPVEGASVVVLDERTGVSRSYTSNEVGAFLAARLPVGGPYKVTVNGVKEVTVDSITLGDVYNLTINLQSAAAIEEVVVVGQSATLVDTAAGPAATFTSFDLDSAVSFDRDITEVYTVDPRVFADLGDRGSAINCAGKHPRFNSVTLDGVGMNDRFGLNNNGYSTATGMPFPYDAIEQVAVELAPFDVTYGGFSACNINAVTKAGSNEWEGGVWFEWNNEQLRADSIEVSGENESIGGAGFNNRKRGFNVGGPIIKDRLFFYLAYEEEERPTFNAMGFAGSGNGVERPWLSQAEFDRIVSISQNLYNYDPGGQPGNTSRENEKYMIRLDWNINENHNLAFIHNYTDGFQINASDNDSNEFEFANHFYEKSAEQDTYTAKLASQWTDSFSTEFFYSYNEMIDGQNTIGPKDFGDHQITLEGPSGRNTVYLGADDSRQANNLSWESDFYKLTGQWLAGDHVITAGFEREELSVFNIFVQHSNGGEWDYFDDSANNPAFCAALSAQGRFEDPACGMSGIDRFELGRPSRIYYGSAGGTNNPLDAAAMFTNNKNTVYIQDELYIADHDLSLVFGLRYDWFDSDDRPNFNAAASAAYGIRNDANIDGIDLLQPRFGFTWGARDDLTVRGGIGLYSGGNPNVWLSNAWSNDGITNVQLQFRNFSGSNSVFDGSIPLTGQGRPGYDVPQTLVDQVAATGPESGSIRNTNLVDPNYKQPGEWKVALGATWDMPWGDWTVDVDYLYSRGVDPVLYRNVSLRPVGTTTTGAPIYANCSGCGAENYMLTNSDREPESHLFSVVFQKEFENGLDLTLGYAYNDAEDVSPMTSFTAETNFSAPAVIDLDDPLPGTTNYLVPQRLTMRASWGTEIFDGLETRFSLYGYSSEGQPQSWVMSSDGQEPDRPFGRHLLYVPSGPSDPNVVYSSNWGADDQAGFDAFIEREGLARGQYVERNSHHAGWSTRFNLRVTQEFPFFGDTYGRIFLNIYNIGNLINDGWGIVTDAEFFPQQVITNSVNESGQFVFDRFSDGSVEDVIEPLSAWEARFGIEFNF